MTAPTLSKLGLAALAYAEKLGWRVFTCFPKQKKPMNLCPDCLARLPAKDPKTNETTCRECGTIHTGKSGLYFATSDPETIKAWWTKEPNANIGVATGRGILVLDIDVPDPERVPHPKYEDGDITFAELLAEHGDFPETARQRTGQYKQADGTMRRGWQYVFTVEGEIKNSAGSLGHKLDADGKKIPSGIDIRGDGGYVVVHPSLHPSGVAYEWDPEHRPTSGIAPAPQWLLTLLRPDKKISEAAAPKPPADVKRPAREVGASGLEKWVEAAVDGEYERVATAGPGTRNQALNTAAFKLGQIMHSGLLPDAHARQALQAGAEKCGYAGEEGAEHVEAVISSGLAAGMANPREMPAEREPYKGTKSAKSKPQLVVVGDNTKPDHAEKKKRKKKDDDEGKPVDPKGWAIDDWEDHVEFKADTKMLSPKAIRNAIAMLLYRLELQDLFVLNKRMQQVIITRKPMWTANGHPYPRALSDNDIIGLQSYLESHGLRLTKSSTADAISFSAREREFDKVVENLNGFVWDGKDRLDHWLETYLGVEGSGYSRAVGSKWLISGVARILKPGCKVDHMLVLEGEQGLGKSTALRALCEALAPDVYTDRLSPFKDKDSMIELLGKVIVEMAELVAFKGASAEQIKRFLSAQEDDLRLPWDRTTSRLLRGCIFAGTVNPDGLGWLTDPTGNRRFWPVEVTEVHLEALKRDAPQLWAEARARFQTGEAWWLDDPEVAEDAARHVSRRVQEDVWAQKIDDFIKPHDFVRMSEVLTELGVTTGQQGPGEERRVGQHLRKRNWRAGFKQINKETVRVWYAPEKKDLFARDE